MSQTGRGVDDDWDTAIKVDGNYNPSPEPARCNWKPEMQPVMERGKGGKSERRARERWCRSKMQVERVAGFDTGEGKRRTS